MKRRLFGVIPFVAAAAVLAAGAPAGTTTLSHARYQELLTRAHKKVTRVESAVEQGLTPKTTRGQARSLLLAWAQTETNLGQSFRAVSPPADARRGNAALWQGELTFGAELARAARHLPLKRSRVGPFIQRRLENARGGPMIDAALALLNKAGYKVD